MYEYLSEKYDDILNELFNKVFYLPTDELKFFLKKTDQNLNNEDIANILFSAQRREVLLLSEDGWAISKRGYRRYIPRDGIDDEGIVNARNSSYSLKKLCPLITNYEVYPKNIFSSLWVALDMFPFSRDFILGTSPWDIVFDMPETEDSPCQLYQITTIPKEIEDARCLFLSQLDEHLHDNDKEIITRIAVIEDENSAWKVPKIGFRYIVKLNHNSLHHYDVLEKREKDIWG